MPEFLSDDWIAALDDAARHDDDLRATAAELDVVLQQMVTGTERGDVAYHIVLTPTEVGVHAGKADAPTISFTTDLATATAISKGEQSAQSAFIDGHIRVGGDLRRLLDAQAALAQLGDTFHA